MSARGRLGPLRERDFRLLFTATTITTLGDRLGHFALAFAVLDLPDAGARELGIVLAVRSLFQSVVVVFGGVLADRLPRHLVLVGASLIQGVAQAVVAALVLTGSAEVWSLIALSVLYGVGGGVVIPAEIGLVPQTVSADRLQQANAFQGLSRNVIGVLGPSSAGVIVVAGSPGAALAADAVSFFAAAWLLSSIRIAVRADEQEETGFLHELRAGWREFTRHSWLWSTVLLFGVSNLAFVGVSAVLGPLIADLEYSRLVWSVVLTSFGVGSIVGGLIALRYRPRRPLLASVLVAQPLLLNLLALGLFAPAWVLMSTSFLTGLGIAIHLALWFTVFQREVPEQMQSRVSSYDALGSFVLIPLGMAAAGPLAAWVGVQEAVLLALAVCVVCQVAIVSVPSVWRIRAPEPVPETA
jgi:MFS family permease